MNLKQMSFKAPVKGIAGLAAIAIVAVALSSFLPSEIFSTGDGKSETTEIRNSLSGRIGSDGPILAVKIDDTAQAHPQAGLEDADIVYIEQVEGGLTRLAAIFSSVIPPVVGPVRSARISDLEILEQFGRVAFAYSGAQSKLLPVIAASNVINLGAQRQSPKIYSTDPMRRSPTSMMLQAQDLMANVAAAELPVAISKPIGWSFGEKPEIGRAISSVKVSWPANSYDATWSSTENRWLLSQRGVLNLSASGIHLGPTTFLIQLVAITESIYKDKVGGVTPYSQTVGAGRGYVMRDGFAIAANWNRPSGDQGTTWTTVAGDEIKFSPGQIWIALTDKTPVFTPVAMAINEDATPPAAK
jgi:Protein of unknown function (DUF3048) N-terminal domain/Protein of unknown function (DUF3048) C-terminal domain